MRLTKYTHSCIRLDDGSRSLVIDPGVFSEAATALAGAQAVLITHEHPDHLDTAALLEAARANTELRVWAPAPVVEKLAELGDRVTAVGPGASFDAAGFGVRTFGGLHALIHPLVGGPIANNAYLIDESIYHPGDSFTVPPAPVQTLLVPIHAPWSKVSEVLDFMVSVRAPRAFQIHDGLLNDIGSQFVDNHLKNVSSMYGRDYTRLASGRSVDLK